MDVHDRRAVRAGGAAVGLLALVAGCGGPDPVDSQTPGTSPAPALEAVAGEDVAGPVGSAIRFDGSASSGDQFLWDFGDGSVAEGAVAEHTYSVAGNYTAVLQVTAADGGFRTDSLLAVAYNPALGPSRPSSMLTLDETGTPWVVVPEAGTVVRVDPAGPTVTGVCDDPRGLAASGDRLVVACGADQLVTLSLPEGVVQQTVDLPRGSAPRMVASSGSGWEVALAGSGQVVGFDGVLAGPTPVHVLDDPRGLAVGTTGSWAARYRSVDGEGRLVGPVPITLDFDPGPDSDTTTRGVPTALEYVVLSPDEGWLYAGGTLGNTARGLYRDGQIPTFETSVRAFVDAVDPATGARRWRKQFDDHGLTGPLALSEHGNWLFVGFPTTRDVLVLDAYSGDIVSSILNTGLGIRGLQRDGDTLHVYAWLDRTVHSWDISSIANPVLLQSVSVAPTEPLTDPVLLGKRVFWDASDTRMTKAGYVSCAVCHPDGEHDGLTWDFTDRGEGLRNTSSLLGRGGTAMGPLHWTANFDEVQDFEHDIRGPFSGSGFLSDTDWNSGSTSQTLGDPKAGLSVELDALAAYLISLDQTPVSPFDSDPAGALLFVSAGCAGCHPAPLYTDSPTGLRHDVGTAGPGSGSRLGQPLDGFDTPTLLGSWQTGPWLHDGSAPTLSDAIRAHESAAGLTDPQVDALAAHVRSL